MMKKLKWITFIAVVVGLLTLCYVMVDYIRISADEAKKRNQERVEGDVELVKRMEFVQLEHIEFTDNTTLRQSINFLALRLRESDPPSPLSAKLSDWRKGLSDEFQGKSIGQLKLQYVSLAEAMDVILLRVGCRWKILGGDVMIEHLGNEGNNEIHDKLDRVLLEKLEFIEDTTFRQAINFMRLRARELDDGVPVEKRGLGFVFQDSGAVDADGFGDADKIENRMIGGFSLYNVSLREVLTVICRRGGIQWHVGEYRVIFSNR